MHDIFKDALAGIAAYNQQMAEPKTTDQREIEAALSELHRAHVERARLGNRIDDLEAMVDAINQRIKGKTS